MTIIVEKVFDKAVLEAMGIPHRVTAGEPTLSDRSFSNSEPWVGALLRQYRTEQKIPWERSEHDAWTETDTTFVLTMEFLDKTTAEEYANLRRAAGSPYLISVTVKEI